MERKREKKKCVRFAYQCSSVYDRSETQISSNHLQDDFG